MKMCTIGVAAMAATLAFGASASAAVVTRQFDFTAQNVFATYALATIPFAGASGSFTVTFDTETNYSGATSGIVVNSLSLPEQFPVAFYYSTASRIMNITGGLYGSEIGTDDFVLSMFNADTLAPTNSLLIYTTASHTDSAFISTQLDLKVTDIPPSTPSPVPEPSVWALLIAGFGMTGMTLRARRFHPSANKA